MTKKCMHCKTDIDSTATVCPNCKREQKKKTNPGLVALGIIIAVIGFIGFGVSLSEMTSKTSNVENDAVKNIGEELICDKYKIVINEYKFKTGSIDSFYKVPDGEEWVGLIITATNTSSENVNIYASNFKLINSNGEVIDNDYITYKVWGNYPTIGGELAPGGTKTGYIAFSNNNTDNSNLNIKFECGFWQDGKYTIPLK